MICPVSFVKTIDDSFVNSGFPSEASGMSVNWVNTVVPTVHILHHSPISNIQQNIQPCSILCKHWCKFSKYHASFGCTRGKSPIANIPHWSCHIAHCASHRTFRWAATEELIRRKGGSVLHYSPSNSSYKPKLRIKHSLLLHMWRSHWSCTQRSAATVGRHAKLISERRVHLCRALRQQRLSRS